MELADLKKENRLGLLFDVELQYKQGMSAVMSSEGKLGKHVGSGDGTIRGARIHGTVHWDLFEDQGESVCGSNLRGLIETNDEAHIQFDAMGFFMRPDKSKPNRWITSAAVRFDTADKRYKWLNTRLAVWEGQFDMKTGRHHYRVYSQVAEE